MYVSFDQLPPQARIWIYQSDKKITAEQNAIISQALHAFSEQWSVHGMPMETSFEIRYNRFIILGANDQASGCSIDSSVRTLKGVGESLGINFFDRNQIAFLQEAEVVLIPMNQLKATLEQGKWNNSTQTFNNLASTKAELEKNWILPAAATWLKRYFPKETVSN